MTLLMRSERFSMPEADQSSKVAVIVPAYNEEDRIAEVLKVLVTAEMIGEIIVVDDGSTDRTSASAEKFSVNVVRLAQNKGKGGAMIEGARATDAEVVAFIDADLVGLKEHHVNDLIRPVLDGEADMTVGMFSSGRLRTDLSQKMFPSISGQRAVKRSVFDKMENLENTKYGIELAITQQAKRLGLKTVEVLMAEITHVMKEEKLGYTKGVLARLRMYKDMLDFYLEGNKTKP